MDLYTDRKVGEHKVNERRLFNHFLWTYYCYSKLRHVSLSNELKHIILITYKLKDNECKIAVYAEVERVEFDRFVAS